MENLIASHIHCFAKENSATILTKNNEATEDPDKEIE